MQIRSKQALRTQAAGVLFTLIGFGALAVPATRQKETSLLGIRLHASYSDVLRKFGQPTEIQIGEPVATASPQTGGMMGGGMPGMGRMGGGLPGMGGPSGMPPGMMSGGPMGGMSGAPMGMPPSMMQGYQNAMNRGAGGMPGMGGPSLPGMSAPMGGKGEGGGPNLPGLPGGGFPGSGMRGLPGLGGLGGRTGAAAQTSGGEETTWWYHFPKQGLHYSFLFNKQGHVIQIQAYGYKSAPNIPAARTAEGITLGAPLADVIRRYGWSSDGDHSGDYVVFRYGTPNQIAFQSRHNEVIGIVLGDVSP